MRRTNLRIVFSVLIAMGLSACEEVVTDKIPSEPKKLVVSSFISPSDDSAKVSVSWSRPYYGTEDVFVPAIQLSGSTVTITDGTITKNLVWNSKEENFVIPKAQFPIVAGNSYGLSVTTVDGTKVQASTTVPTAPLQPTFERVEVRKKPGNDNSRLHVFRFTVNDPAGVQNFYRFDLYLRNNEGGINSQFFLTRKLLNDKHRDGTTIEEFLEFEDFGESVGRSVFFDAYFIAASQEYNLFHESLEKNNLSEDNPFAEPVQLYGNITGGYGIFAGFSRVRVTKIYPR